MTRENADAVLVALGTFFNTRRVQLAILAARHALPATYPVRAYTEAGGLAISIWTRQHLRTSDY
jgi:hypothetical protein